MKKLLFLFCIFVFFIFPKKVSPNQNNQFVTLVNPVRISKYTQNPKESVRNQYEVIKNFSFPASWLLTYDAMNNEGVYSIINAMDEKQEVGIFLEVTPLLAQAAGVTYNDTGFWHHATSVFLSGYTQEERVKLIDAVFGKFNEVFNYYPKSVGSWWTDGFSLSYMKEEYNITANLTVADQFSTDGYQVWGQYWSTPYYPSKYHAGMPASSEESKLDVVVVQWAHRDPLNGYFSSLYSTQDYFTTREQLDIDYFGKLVKLYTNKGRNKFGQITVGLEGDLTAEAYDNHFREQLELVGKLEEAGEVKVTNMKEFSGWYRDKFESLSPPHAIISNDLLDKEAGQVFWYQSPFYRVGILYDSNSGTTKIFDLRAYNSDLAEPYYQSPNKEFDLSVYIPSYFDEVNYKDDVWQFDAGVLEHIEQMDDGLKLFFEEEKTIRLTSDGIVLEKFDVELPKVLSKSLALNVSKLENDVKILIKDRWLVPREGVYVKELTEEATHHLARKRTTAKVLFIVIILLTTSFVVIYLKIGKRRKLIILSLLIIPSFLYSYYWYEKNSTQYYVSQAEVDALYRLSVLPPGKVVVYDKECLGCVWHTYKKPAALANKRNYVQKHGGHPIVYNLSTFTAKNQNEAKQEFDKLNAEYIYLVKYEDYIERTPFSPGDLGIEKIYGNANAELWRVK